jgi:hypothetical protein
MKKNGSSAEMVKFHKCTKIFCIKIFKIFQEILRLLGIFVEFLDFFFFGVVAFGLFLEIWKYYQKFTEYVEISRFFRNI